jgi:Ferritin-like
MTPLRIEMLPAPLGVEEWTKLLLIERLKLGMQVELSTIPLYLYAYYSINVEASIPEDQKVAGANARFAILGLRYIPFFVYVSAYESHQV